MIRQVDIAVVGAGAAGIAAAVSASRAGCTVLLLDGRFSAGGIGGFSGLTTFCGLYDDKGEFLNEGFSREFAQAVSDAAPELKGRVWTLAYLPEKFRAVASQFLAEANVQTQWNTALNGVVAEGGHITALNGVRVSAVIDCSGGAAVAQAVGAPCLETNARTQAPAVVFSMRNISCPLTTPAEAARVMLPMARAGLPPASIMPNLEPGGVTVKFSGRPDQVGDWIAFLRTNVPGFERCETTCQNFTVSQRAGRMIVGHHVLTGVEILEGRKFTDAVARGAWPIEQWSANGIAHYRYLPPGAYYEIPARSLRGVSVENLFLAGKTISADEDAIASARVMGCCLATGAAAGTLAAQWQRAQMLADLR